MHAVKVEAQLTITSAPIERVGRRATDPPLKIRNFVFATARGGDLSPVRWSIYAFTPTARAALAKLGPGDVATVMGLLAIRVDQHGAPVVAVECRSMRSPKAAPRQSGRCGATRMADPDRVAEANRKWHEKHGGFAP
jgi:hypothetical protein